MGKKKFIDKSKSVHYQVVHRSQRDPALADEESSRYVLKPVPPSYNLLKKGKYEAEVPDADYPEYEERDGEYDGSEVGFSDEEEEGEWTDDEEGEEEGEERVKGKPQPKADTTGAAEADPSLYGIFFTDQEKYDYLKHLKPIGEDPSAVFMEAKNSQSKKDKSGGIQFVDADAQEAHSGQRKTVAFQLPSEALASEYETRVGLLNQPAVPSMLDVGSDVREVLYALDDDAYVQEDADDDFFAALDMDEVPERFEAEVAAAEEREREQEDRKDEEGGEWYKAYRRYKKGETEDLSSESNDDDDEDDEEEYDSFNADASLPRSTNTKKWDAQTADTSFSAMSSSTMFRNANLTHLDTHFDAVLADYSDTEIGELDPDDTQVRGDNLLPQSRLESLFDDFLESTELMGKRKQRLVTKIDRMGLIDTVRDELKENARDAARMYKNDEGYMRELSVEEALEGCVVPEEKVRDMWDCETVLTTYTNVYNRPRLIAETGTNGKAPRRIRLKGKMGMPVVEDAKSQTELAAEKTTKLGEKTENADGSGAESDTEPLNRGTARPRTETPAERKMRKQEVKAERRNRREEKKATKAAFKDETKRQAKTFRNVVRQEASVHIV
ncbi:uncharacterized protein EV422DRAFT_546605 [Fimicolochytrium jonesii]|uniref:uncharacterized protein n=1 Tax=Fimicolochytrium jonesii TaxID=1396493 RepID=UPI0022FE2E91|nr:uncharacterized protein EV422DRAFT_546605 [Fimicolochytrium jonesii]KAI8816229.1 hypothetical protein EV422DRAFT_546605 [Fimicolochytrium jonesii]